MVLMLLCPKCGFEQPEDVYCAKCGVNMSKFSGRKIGPKPIIIASVIGGIILFGWIISILSKSMVGIEKSASQSQKIYDEYDRDTPVTPEKTDQQSGAQTAVRKEAKLVPLTGILKKETPPPKALNSPTNLSATAADIAGPSNESSKTSATAEKITNKISVQFYTISKENADKMNLQVGQASANLLQKSIFDTLSKDSTSQSLGSENRNLSLNQPTSFSQMSEEPRTKGYIGFLIQVTAVRITDSQADYKINVKRNLPEVSTTGELKIVSADFAENITINQGQVYGITGLLPRKNLYQNEDQLYRGNILRPLTETPFQKFEQEFVIFFIP
jgi:hypothetical protein